MPRKFIPFDSKVIRRELQELDHLDFRDLTFAMKNYQEETGVGYAIDNYGEVMMIKGRRQGRGLFFAHVDEQLVLLAAYKKESQKVPQQILELAIARKKAYKDKQK